MVTSWLYITLVLGLIWRLFYASLDLISRPQVGRQCIGTLPKLNLTSLPHDPDIIVRSKSKSTQVQYGKPPMNASELPITKILSAQLHLLVVSLFSDLVLWPIDVLPKSHLPIQSKYMFKCAIFSLCYILTEKISSIFHTSVEIY